MGGGVEVEEGVMRVLLVDDSPVDRRVVQLLLNSNSCAGSFHVIAVDSAKKAMEFLGLKDGKVKMFPHQSPPVSGHLPECHIASVRNNAVHPN
uniref:Response regulatory domain-containing protein n=1 Tax=Arundo donax TaxID=35708 RepID=A0A0A9GLC2_ARUDO